MVILIVLFILAVIVIAGVFMEAQIMGLQDKIDRIQTDLDTLTTTVTEVVAEIADLKLKVGETVTQEQSDAIDALSTKLEKATADLKAGE